MPRFLSGDELGYIKSLDYLPSSRADSNVTVSTLYDARGERTPRAVQKMAISISSDSHLVRYPGGTVLRLDRS
jgi:hypothetical protein